MDAAQKKIALRMIPYGLYVLTAESEDGEISAATVNWVTQASFEPPLVVVGVKSDSTSLAIIRKSRAFALNVLGKGQQSLAFTFFKPAVHEGDQVSGQKFRHGTTGSPILESTPAFVECKVLEIVGKGDHAVVIGEVVEAGATTTAEGRPDDATLWLKDLGEKTFYGG